MPLDARDAILRVARPEALQWAWRSIVSRDWSKIRRGGQASGLKRATPCHVFLASDRTARAEPLLLIAEGDTPFRVALIAEMREHPG